jgi:RimJ/RimL family protein N-acetyltransferase
MSPIPRLETERLVLRAHEPGDLDAFQAVLADPDVFRFLSGSAIPREESWKILVRHRGMRTLFGFGYFVIIEKATDRMIGEAGL